MLLLLVNQHGLTAIMQATMSGHVEAVRTIAAAGADVSSIDGVRNVYLISH
jgi:hypothetical protein